MPGTLINDTDVTLLKAGVATGSNKASGVAWSAVAGNTSYGGAADLWGAAWTPADINAATFGVQLSANSASTVSAQVDYMQITVTYSVGGAPGSMMMTGAGR